MDLEDFEPRKKLPKPKDLAPFSSLAKVLRKLFIAGSPGLELS